MRGVLVHRQARVSGQSVSFLIKGSIILNSINALEDHSKTVSWSLPKTSDALDQLQASAGNHDRPGLRSSSDPE